MSQYNQEETPAPVAIITIRNPATNDAVTGVTMLLDTGADTTLIPRLILPALGITANALKQADYSLVGFDGTRIPAYLASVKITFIGKTLRGDFPLTDADYGIIGRDVLNRFRLVFDGPRQVWEEVAG